MVTYTSVAMKFYVEMYKARLTSIPPEEFNCIKGVLHPRLVFGLFLHFSQKLQHIGKK